MARFGQLYKEHGVDEEASWIMVPHKGVNMVLLHDGKDLELKCSGNQCIDMQDFENPRSHAAQNFIAKLKAKGVQEAFVHLFTKIMTLMIPPSSRLIIVQGMHLGTTTLKAVDRKNGRQQTSFAVNVIKQREVNVTFNFLRHIHKDTKKILEHTMLKSYSDVPDWIKFLNQIYAPQANVMFKANDPRSPIVEKHLDAILTSKDWPDIVAQRDAKAEWNVFIVGKWEHDKRDYNSTRTGTTFKGKNSICDEEARTKDPLEETMAHEALHALSDMRIGDPPDDSELHPQWLVENSAFRVGYKIPKQHVKEINPF